MEENTATGGEPTEAVAGKSIEDELGAVFDGLMAEREPEVFELPGWGSKLQVKYRVLTEDEGEEIGKKIAEQVGAGEVDNAALAAKVDALIKSCLGFYTERDGKLVPLNETLREPTDRLIKWDRTLAALFSSKLQEIFGVDDVTKLTGRQIVSGVLKNDNRLVWQHGTEVERWSDRELRRVHADFD